MTEIVTRAERAPHADRLGRASDAIPQGQPQNTAQLAPSGCLDCLATCLPHWRPHTPYAAHTSHGTQQLSSAEGYMGTLYGVDCL